MLARTQSVEVEDGILQEAREMVPVLRHKAADIGVARALPYEIIEQLREKDLLCMLRPAAFGGKQRSLRTVIKTSNELARGDASVAWVHSVYTGHDLLISRFSAQTQEAFWSSADLPLCASSLVPTGKAQAVDGGWELSGTWSFCSGIDHADWIILGAFTGMVAGPPPRPERSLFMVPAKDYAIVDDWHVMGLQGTGSKSVVLDKVFVSAENAVGDEVMGRPSASESDNSAEARYAVWPLISFALVGLASTIAQNASEHAVGDIKAGAGKPNPLFDIRRPAAAAHLAEASAKIDCAALLYNRALDQTFAIVDAGEELTLERRVRNRRDQCYAAKLAFEATSSLLSIGGGRGIREGGVVQRAHRDLTALTLHPSSNWDATALSYGTVAMGGEPTELIF